MSAWRQAGRTSANPVKAGAFRATTSRLPFAWAFNAVADAQRIFGQDCWPYGIEPNRRTLEAFLQYAYEQGVTTCKLKVEELFPCEVQAFART